MSGQQINETPTQLDEQHLIALYASLQTVRIAELRLHQLFADGEVPGFIHSSVGQEAVPVGVMSALRTSDSIASTHRGHGHAIAKGVELDKFFQEILAKRDGCCGGRGGSMHVADARLGMLGANGIVGAGVPIALGSALSHQIKKDDAVAVAFFGDGALAEGVIYECLNLASLWKLPLIFICENNGWSEFSPTARQFSASVLELAAVFQIPTGHADGNDVLAVRNETTRAVRYARTEGPFLLEFTTQRVRGHFEGDAQKYRPPAELTSAVLSDPIKKFELYLAERGVAPETVRATASEVAARIELAITAARTNLAPAFADAFSDVYTAVASHV